MAPLYRTPEGAAEVSRLYEAVLAEWPVPIERRTVLTNQGETFVLIGGPEAATPLLLLHGSAANSASWIGDFGSWSEHFRVFAVDIIGEPGRSAPLRPPPGTEAYAEWLGEVMDGLGISSAAVLGLSLGGWLALDFAIRRPHRVNKLVLISPGGVARNRNILIWALPLLLLGSWGRRKMLERIGGEAMTSPAFTESSIGRLSAAIFRHFKPRTERLPTPGPEALRGLGMPVMAVLGGKDVFIHANESRAILEANVPRLTMRYLPEGLHFLPGQAGAVLEFLRDGQ